VYPADGELQLPAFGAKAPWPELLASARGDRVLLIMVRHGEAWENVNPLSNDQCEFMYEGTTINNLDSDLDDVGVQQARDLNSLLRSDSPYSTSNSSRTWFAAMGLANKVQSMHFF
jgi:hypothetical protein